jgi:protein-L-isoaspartate(D-aspartate) O-methyltransferase
MNPSFSDTETARFNMIEQQIRPWDVLDPAVLELLGQIHREDFVPQSHRHLAFVDMEVPLPHGQVMLAPKVEARLLQELNLSPSDRVLEIGTGSGFMAALLGRSSQDVLTIEKYPDLKTMAEENLSRAGVTNVKVIQGNGLSPEDSWVHMNFEAIVVSGAVHSIPQHLLNALSNNGRLVAIVGQAPIMQAQLVERVTSASGHSSFRTTTLFETLTKPLEDAPKISRFKF